MLDLAVSWAHRMLKATCMLLLLQDACVTKHCLGYIEQVATAMAPSGCLSVHASSGSERVFAATFVLALNVAKTTACMELQVRSL